VFWAVVWALGGEFSSGGSTTTVGWEGPAVNLLLLVPLWRRSVLAWHVLAIWALIPAIFLLFPINLEPWHALGLLPAMQFLLLWRMRTSGQAALAH
jgi:hypothetical protein